MAFSRRAVLSFIGLLPFLTVRLGRASASAGAVHPVTDGLVVVNGWVLRRDDLNRQMPQ